MDDFMMLEVLLPFKSKYQAAPPLSQLNVIQLWRQAQRDAWMLE
jgi:hypothetical protein